MAPRFDGVLVPSTGVLFGKVAEILPDTLFFASFVKAPHSDANVRYVNIDERVHYEPFYTDFGPLNLSVLYRFTKYLNGILELQSRRKIVLFTNADEKNRVNGAYIAAAYAIIYHGMSADSAYLRVQCAEPPQFTGFRDAAMGEPTYLLHLHDVLRGIERALEHKWLDFSSFDADEYEAYERVENGDLNWIIPGKILSFCGPHNHSVVENGYPYHAPDVYFDYFSTHGVSTIVRLNMRMYDAKKFTDAGFDHVDLFFIDGSTPSDEIVEKFIQIVDNARGGVAVHCKAGLGRTGTLIACWMMKEYGLTAAECMAWLRVCRPGSVIGPQQEFLVRKQKFCWAMSSNQRVVHMPPRKHTDGHGKHVHGLANKVEDIRLGGVENGNKAARHGKLHAGRSRGRNSGGEGVGGSALAERALQEETRLDAQGRSQGDRLLQVKARQQHSTPQSSVGCSRSSAAAAALTPRTPAAVPSRLLANGSPRFSSPTTPIKPMGSASPASLPPRPRLMARQQLVPTRAPVSGDAWMGGPNQVYPVYPGRRLGLTTPPAPHRMHHSYSTPARSFSSFNSLPSRSVFSPFSFHSDALARTPPTSSRVFTAEQLWNKYS